MQLGNLKTFDIDRKRKYVFLVSLGSLEQHGTFLPLLTDSLIQDAMLKKVEEQLKDILILPTIPISCSSEHLGFLGTVSLQKNTLKLILKDICDSLKNTASTILFLSWHGGNKSVVDTFISENLEEYPNINLAQVAFGDDKTDMKIEKILNGPLDDHAGNTEISMICAINESLVTKPKATDKKVAVDFNWDRPVIEVTKMGIIDSHPEWIADSDVGDKIIDIFSSNLVKVIKKKIYT